MPPTAQLRFGDTASPRLRFGDSITLNVEVTYNNPINSITWEYNGSTVTNNERDTIAISTSLPAPISNTPLSSSLQRSSVTINDAGEYIFTATNSIGAARLSFNVTVLGKQVSCGGS